MEHLQAGRERELRELVGVAVWLDIAGALAGCVIAFFGVDAMGRFFGWSADLQWQALLFTFVMLLSVRSTAVGILRLHDRFKAGAAADAVTPIARMVGAAIVLLSGPTIAGFLLAWAAAEIATAIACWVFAARTAGSVVSLKAVPRFRHVLRTNPGLGGFATSTNLSYTLEAVTKQFSTVIVGLFVGAAAAGHYRLAFQLGQGFAKISDVISRAVYSELTRVRFGDGLDSLAKLFRQSMRFSMIAGIVIVLILFLIGKPALLLVAGAEFAPAYPLLLLLGTAAALDFGGVNFEPALLATGRAAMILKIRLLIACLLVALLLTLLPTHGAAGAAIAALCASVTGLLLFGLAAWRAVHRSQAL
jgi:O-antigen/teichoic acid export membrane protein